MEGNRITGFEDCEEFEDFDLEPCPRCGSEATGEAYGENECFQCNYTWYSNPLPL